MRSFASPTALLFALTFTCAAPALAQDNMDAVKTDAAHHKVEFENDQVRVVRWVIPPGEKTANHSHPNNVNILLADANAKVTTPDGKTNDLHAKAGAATWRAGGIHIVENVGTQPMEGILIEPKKPSSKLPAGATDVVVADPKHSTVAFENDQLRVIRYHYEPGETAAMHGHPDNVRVCLTDAKENITAADGKTKETTAKAGQVMWRPATQHATQNTGGALDGYTVEMKGGK